MSPETSITIQPTKLFWDALDADDYQLAGRILWDELDEACYAASVLSNPDSFVNLHLPGLTIEGLGWDDGHVSGTIFLTAKASLETAKVAFYLDVLACKVELLVPSKT
jgi:hypothetical protein